MADVDIVQKYEIRFVPTRLFCVTQMHDLQITLLPDCERLHAKHRVRTFRRLRMKRWIAVLLAVTGIVGTARAYAQEVHPGPGRVEINIVPAGGVFFTEDHRTRTIPLSVRPTGKARTIRASPAPR